MTTDIHSYEYFLEEFHRFFEVMSTPGYTIKQRELALRGFCHVALGCPDPRVQDIFEIGVSNFEYRMAHFLKEHFLLENN